MLGIHGSLCQCHATLFFDACQANSAIGPGAGEYDRNRPLAVNIGKRSKENIDRDMLADRSLEWTYIEATVEAPMPTTMNDTVLFSRPGLFSGTDRPLAM